MHILQSFSNNLQIIGSIQCDQRGEVACLALPLLAQLRSGSPRDSTANRLNIHMQNQNYKHTHKNPTCSKKNAFHRLSVFCVKLIFSERIFILTVSIQNLQIFKVSSC